MKVHGMVDPGSFTVENIPETNRSLIRLFQNVKSVQNDDFEGFEYDEYHVEVESWDGIFQNVQNNYDEFLGKGIDNEIDRSNETLFQNQIAASRAIDDADAMNVDQEYRLTMLELGLTDSEEI